MFNGKVLKKKRIGRGEGEEREKEKNALKFSFVSIVLRIYITTIRLSVYFLNIPLFY